MSLQIQASDVDVPANTLSYSAQGLPAGLTINASSGLIGGTIAAGAATSSPYTAIVTVTDGQGGSTPVSFQWSVTPSTPGPCGSDPSLVACWPMDEGSGATAHDGGAAPANDASLVGSPVWVAGQHGQALRFDGGTQYGTTPDEASLDIVNQITIAAWIRPEEYDTQDLIKKATNGTVDGYELTLATTKTDASSRRVFFRINQDTSGDTYRINATTEYPIDGTWMHVAGTYDGETMRLYVNGVEESSLAVVMPIPINNDPLRIGGESVATRNYLGAMDDARVYNRALTAVEIATLAALDDYPPVAAGDNYFTPQDTALNVAAPGVLGNDTDADGDPLTAIKVSDPAHGTVTLQQQWLVHLYANYRLQRLRQLHL